MKELLILFVALVACAPAGLEAEKQRVQKAEQADCEEQWLFCESIKGDFYRQQCEHMYNTSPSWGCTDFPMGDVQ
jgi:hypothetical protein